MTTRLIVSDWKGDASEFTFEDASSGFVGLYGNPEEVDQDLEPQARWGFDGSFVLIHERLIADEAR